MPLKLPFYFLAVCMLHDPAFHCFLDKIPPHFFGAEDAILPSVPEMEFLDMKLIKDFCSMQLEIFTFYWRILLMKTILFLRLKNPYKKSAKQENWSLFMNSIF